MKKTLIAIAAFGCAASLHAAVILAPGADWEYTFTQQSDNAWTQSVGGWAVGAAPFGNTYSGDFAANTIWNASGANGYDLFVRRKVNLTGIDLGTVNWGLGVDNGYKLFVNGTEISQHNAEGFTTRWEYTGLINSSLLNSGENIVAVALEDHGGLTAFDMTMWGTVLPAVSEPPLEAVPEPTTLALFGLGALGLGLARRKLLSA